MLTRYTIRLSPALCPDWMEDNEFFSPVLKGLSAAPLPPGAEVLATCQWAGSGICPLVIKVQGKIIPLFDVAETVEAIRTEHYPGAGLSVAIPSLLPFDYSKLPMWFIGLMSRILTPQRNMLELPACPSYPLDLSADIFKHAAGLTDHRVRWPHGKKYAVVFTHDVDTPWIFNHPDLLDKFISAEEDNGVTSAWYVVPLDVKHAPVSDGVKALLRSGHEIAAHGYDHNPSLPSMRQHTLVQQLKKSYDIISEVTGSGSVGYRAPWGSRNDNLYEAVRQAGFFYDSSTPTADFHRNNKQSNNGCCTVFPFTRNGVPVLPLSIPLDVAYVSFGMSPLAYWRWIFTLTEKVKKAGGVVVITTHLQPHYSANEQMLAGYRSLIEKLAGDEDAWITLPRNIIKRFHQHKAIQREEEVFETNEAI